MPRRQAGVFGLPVEPLCPPALPCDLGPHLGKLRGPRGEQITHRGKPVTAIDAVPLLQRLAGRAGVLAPLLNCNGTAGHPIPDSDVPELQWSACPLCMLSAPWYQSLRVLASMADVSPLSGWPDRYAVWTVHGLIALHQARPSRG